MKQNLKFITSLLKCAIKKVNKKLPKIREYCVILLKQECEIFQFFPQNFKGANILVTDEIFCSIFIAIPVRPVTSEEASIIELS